MGAVAGAARTPLRVIDTQGGPVLHMVRADTPGVKAFGEVYFSEVEPGAVKAWKRHARMTQNFAVPVGRLRVVLYDDRPGSPTRGALAVHELGRPDAYALLTIPPGVWYGFAALGDERALVCNCADMPHDPAESERLDPADSRVPYDWRAQALR